MRSLELTRRAERRVLTVRGWALVALAIGIGVVSCGAGIHPFLAQSRPVDAELLVVEGWLPDAALAATAERFRSGRYELLITTGGPLIKGSHLSAYGTIAELAAATLLEQGFEARNLAVVPAPSAQRDRTYAAALALKRWLAATDREGSSVDLISLGPHARRSRLLFAMALGPEVEVGIISTPHLSYDADRWWASSAGVRTVLSEAIAYAYARLIFSPPAAPRE